MTRTIRTQETAQTSLGHAYRFRDLAEDLREELEAFIARNGLSMSASRLEARTDGLMDDDAKWSAEASHWSVRLEAGNMLMRITYSMGSGHHGREPELAEVLDSLASDCSGVANNESFADWAGHYGYDTDSRKAERIYAACVEQCEALRLLLGAVEFDRLVWHTERL